MTDHKRNPADRQPTPQGSDRDKARRFDRNNARTRRTRGSDYDQTDDRYLDGGDCILPEDNPGLDGFK